MPVFQSRSHEQEQELEGTRGVFQQSIRSGIEGGPNRAEVTRESIRTLMDIYAGQSKVWRT